mgnify:CR=1 FL=1|jgi:hypothetical protein
MGFASPMATEKTYVEEVAGGDDGGNSPEKRVKKSGGQPEVALDAENRDEGEPSDRKGQHVDKSAPRDSTATVEGKKPVLKIKKRRPVFSPKFIGLYVTEARFNLPLDMFPHKTIDIKLISDGSLVSSATDIPLKSTLSGRSTVALCDLLSLLEFEQLNEPFGAANSPNADKGSSPPQGAGSADNTERNRRLSRRRSFEKLKGSYLEVIVSHTGEVFAQIRLSKDHVRGRRYDDDDEAITSGVSGVRDFWVSGAVPETKAYIMLHIRTISMVEKPNKGNSRIEKSMFEYSSLSECPKYDRYGIRVDSTETLQRKSASWQSFFDCENDFYRITPWHEAAAGKYSALSQRHPFELLGDGGGEGSGITDRISLRSIARNSGKKTKTKEQLKSDCNWRNNVWHCFIPQNIRMNVYLEISGANLKRRKEAPSYYKRLCRRKATETDALQIEVDLPRTFAGHQSFINTDTGMEKLRRILLAFSCRNRAIGYCQAMNYLVARLLMLSDDEEDVFWVLCAICEDIFPGYWVPSMTGVQADLRVLEDLIRARLSRVALKIKRLEIPLTGILSQYLLTLFLLTPSDICFRILDCILLEGGNALLAIAFAYFKVFEHSLIYDAHDFDDFCTLLKKGVEAFHDVSEILALAYNELETVGRSTLSMARYNFRREFNENSVFETRMKQRLKSKLDMPEDHFEGAYHVFKNAMQRKDVYDDVKGEEDRRLSIDYWALDLEHFRAVILDLSPMWKNDISVIDRFFVSLDRTHSGFVDIHEYMYGVKVLATGTDEAKMRLIFQAYDCDDTNRITKGELTCLMDTVYKLAKKELDPGALNASVEACLSVVMVMEDRGEPNDDGDAGPEEAAQKMSLSFAKFFHLATLQPLILKCFHLDVLSVG